MHKELIELLNTLPISKISRYIKDCGKIPQSVEKEGIESLGDLLTTDLDKITTKGFSRKKAKKMQESFRNFVEEHPDKEFYTETYKTVPLDYAADIPMDLLNKIHIKEIARYINDCGKIPNTVENIGVTSLGAFLTLDVEQFFDKGFPRKIVNKRQEEFKKFIKEHIDDVCFLSTNHVLPIGYDPAAPIEVNLQKALDELIEHIGKCHSLSSYIKLKTHKDTIKNLNYCLDALYKRQLELKDVAKHIGLTRSRVEQILYNEFLKKLFNGEEIEFLANLSINTDLVERVQKFKREKMFDEYVLKDGCSNIFFEDVLGVDFLLYNKFSYIIPSREKLCYKAVFEAFISELSAIMKPTPAEELEEIIDSNKDIIRRKVYDENKSYETEFIYQLLYNEKLTQVSNEGVLINPAYIIKYGNNGLGSVHQERALARIIADADGSITKEEIINEYQERYNELLEDNVSLENTKKYGCSAIGKTHWTFQYKKPLIEWIEEYAREKRAFTMEEIINAAQKEDIVYNSEATVRTYIMKYCAVSNRDRSSFCHLDYINSNPYNKESWRTKTRTGLINWIATELRLKFITDRVEELDCNVASEFLYERAKGTQYEEDSPSDYRIHIYKLLYNAKSDSPYELKTGESSKKKWCIIKRPDVFDSTDWENYGKKGRAWQQKIIAEATHIVRHSPTGQMPLMDVVRGIYNEISGSVYEGNEGLSIAQIRQKLIYFIKDRELSHPLILLKRGDIHIVSIDARSIIAEERYGISNRELENHRSTITQLHEFDWEVLKTVLYSELSFCQKWLDQNGIKEDFKIAVDNYIEYIRKSNNNNLSLVVPQKLYEFFVVSNPTSIDRYCIMCNIAKNFEAILDYIYISTTPPYKRSYRKCNGLYDKTDSYGYKDFNDILNNSVKLQDLKPGTYEFALKNLSFVRNADAHGNWYSDRLPNTNGSTEDSRNIERIRQFAALYIFAYAKYLLCTN